jgi:acylphosphatase
MSGGPDRVERPRAADVGPDKAGAGADRIRRHVVAHGRVQGVWFRDATREQASASGVAGWVRNREDGAVEAILEGPTAAVDRLIRFMETGPPRARVERIEVREEPMEGLQGFKVR